MKVRDKTLSIRDYKGRWTEASDGSCPCRPCYYAWECCTRRPGGWEWDIKMGCRTRFNYGCPHIEDPQRWPRHMLRTLRSMICIRCGSPVPKEWRPEAVALYKSQEE